MLEEKRGGGTETSIEHFSFFLKNNNQSSKFLGQTLIIFKK
jgi:hypothetical protein